MNLSSFNRLPNFKRKIGSKSCPRDKTKRLGRVVRLIYLNGRISKCDDSVLSDKLTQTVTNSHLYVQKPSNANQETTNKRDLKCPKDPGLQQGFSISMISNDYEAVTSNFTTITDAYCQNACEIVDNQEELPISKYICIPASSIGHFSANMLPLKLDVASQYDTESVEESKETKTRLLNEEYNKRIGELNALPFKCDSLKFQRRKSIIEDDLRKIDVQLKML
ncbi:unnamed protein product [Phyllotreta striolata]|uniref:Enkurin domain-containing protein n=1 Tax=Phyllotreta striolata TaxID=444603 RepID=A0A9N9TKH9_PHYSR|nr:unnamed protein product [Phyllotreta striolata]